MVAAKVLYQVAVMAAEMANQLVQMISALSVHKKVVLMVEKLVWNTVV